MIDYKQLRAAVDAKLSTDPEFRTIMKRITEGRATFIDTARYSQVLSHILGSEVSKAILNVDDREAVVSHLLHDSYEDINDVFGRVQKNVDKSKGLDLKPQRGEYPGERVEQFVHSLVDPTVEDSVIKRRARAGTETITKSFHDDAIKVNAEFHEEAGLKCYIERIGVDCCQWCSDVAGKYEMKDQPQGIFRRHDNCDCTVIYDGQVLRGQVGNNGRRSKKWVEVPKDAGAAEPVRLTQKQAQRTEHEKLLKSNTAFTENSKVKSDIPITIVAPYIVNSSDYRNRYNIFSEEQQVERTMFTEARKMLLHRTGTEYEDLSFIDSKTGKHITRNDYNVKNKVEPSKRMYKMLHESEPYSIIAIHNHPKSGVPSIDDIGCAYDRRYKYGIIACHNGNIYKYSFIGEFDTSIENLSYVNMLLDNVNKIVYNKEKLADRFATELNNALDQLKDKKVMLEVFLWK